MNLSVSLRSLVLIVGMLLVGSLILPTPTHASQCTFTKTLDMGVIDSEVLCLQQYLNANGYQLTDAGPGSPGNETDKFGSLTQAAVAAWQADNDVSPAIGIFGSVSQAKYNSLTDKEVAETVPESEADRLLSIVDQLKAQIADQQTTNTLPTPQVAGATTDRDAEAAADTLRAVMRMILDTEEQFADLDEDDEDRDDMRDDLTDALEMLFDALYDYFDGDYEAAEDGGEDALEEVTDVYEDAGGESAKSEADDLLDDTEDLYDEIDELIDEAEDEDEDVGDAPKLLKEAREYLDDAQDAFSRRVYRQAISDALDAEEALEDARDEIDLVSDDDADRFVEDIWDEYEKTKRKIADADDDGEDVEEAEDLLDDAERRLKKADIALDDRDYDEAIEYAEEAEDLLDDAEDAIGGGDDEEEAEEAIDDAWDAYRDADDEVDEAEDDDDGDWEEARDLLDDARKKLNKAEDAFDDRDYDEAIEYAEEAEDLIDDALDEL